MQPTLQQSNPEPGAPWPSRTNWQDFGAPGACWGASGWKEGVG